MKNKYLTFGVLAALIFFIAININLSLQRETNNLLTINIEALAQGEGGSTSECYGIGDTACNGQYRSSWN